MRPRDQSRLQGGRKACLCDVIRCPRLDSLHGIKLAAHKTAKHPSYETRLYNFNMVLNRNFFFFCVIFSEKKIMVMRLHNFHMVLKMFSFYCKISLEKNLKNPVNIQHICAIV